MSNNKEKKILITYMYVIPSGRRSQVKNYMIILIEIFSRFITVSMYFTISNIIHIYGSIMYASSVAINFRSNTISRVFSAT